MGNYISLRRERADKVREMRKLLKTADVANDGKGRKFTATEKRSYEAASERIEAIDDELLEIAEADEKRSQRADAAAAMGLKPATAASVRGLSNGRDESGAIYRTVPDAGDPGHNWAADMIKAANGEAEARERLESHTHYVAEMERRTGLTAFTATAGAEYAGPVLTDLGLGGNVPAVYGAYYAAAAEPLPLGMGAEWKVPVATTSSSVTHVAESGAVPFQDWVTATKTIDVQQLAGGLIVSQQWVDLAPQFANAMLATDIAGQFAQMVESYSINSADTNALGLSQIASVNNVATTGTDVSVLWKALLEAKFLVADAGSYSEADCVVMSSLQLVNLLAAQPTPAAGTAVDGKPFGFRFPGTNGSVNAYGDWNGKQLGSIGTLLGCEVIATPAVSNASGTGSDESAIFVLNRGKGHRMYASSMRTRIATQIGIATLSPRVVVQGYFAQFSPHPKAVCSITGEAVEAVSLGA